MEERKEIENNTLEKDRILDLKGQVHHIKTTETRH